MFRHSTLPEPHFTHPTSSTIPSIRILGRTNIGRRSKTIYLEFDRISPYKRIDLIISTGFAKPPISL